MYQEVCFSDFTRAFHSQNRSGEFSYAALGVLFDYLEETDPNYELDVIDICCSYACESVQDIANDHDIDLDDAEGDEEQAEKIVLEYLNQHTIVCGVCLEGIVYCTDF